MTEAESSAHHNTEWTTTWSSPGPYHLRIESGRATGPHGEYTAHRVRSGDQSGGVVGAGSAVVALRETERGREVLLVHQYRVVPDVALWELPRGAADAVDDSLVATGERELLEETGVPATSATLLGLIYPDTGLIGDSVGVVLATVGDEAEPHPADNEADEVAWFLLDDLPTLIRDGLLRDGISLAALALAQASFGDSARRGD